MNKRGWVRILEATIAVLILSGAMLAVYIQRPDSGYDSQEYIYSLQMEILDDIASDYIMRLIVLNMHDDSVHNNAWRNLNDFIAARIPDNFGYVFRVCGLSDLDYGEISFCKMKADDYLATRDFNVFARDQIISADLGTKPADVTYDPKKIRLFIWEKY